MQGLAEASPPVAQEYPFVDGRRDGKNVVIMSPGVSKLCTDAEWEEIKAPGGAARYRFNQALNALTLAAKDVPAEDAITDIKALLADLKK